MSPGIRTFLERWLITTLAVLVAAHIIRGIGYDNYVALFIASLLLGILNAFVRPVMMFLTFPLLIFSLGLFLLVINALLLYFVGFLMRPHFFVETFWAAFWGALLISLISIGVNALLGTGSSRVEWRRTSVVHRRRRRRDDDGGGPIIDV